ncbi:hypothetical protein HDU92_001555 [Lobulomyces angularis]|nr:hypothetical protein HDU92_001555 [Lobulomyces angularis]
MSGAFFKSLFDKEVVTDTPNQLHLNEETVMNEGTEPTLTKTDDNFTTEDISTTVDVLPTDDHIPDEWNINDPNMIPVITETNDPIPHFQFEGCYPMGRNDERPQFNSLHTVEDCSRLCSHTNKRSRTVFAALAPAPEEYGENLMSCQCYEEIVKAPVNDTNCNIKCFEATIEQLSDSAFLDTYCGGTFSNSSDVDFANSTDIAGFASFFRIKKGDEDFETSSTSRMGISINIKTAIPETPDSVKFFPFVTFEKALEPSLTRPSQSPSTLVKETTNASAATLLPSLSAFLSEVIPLQSGTNAIQSVTVSNNIPPQSTIPLASLLLQFPSQASIIASNPDPSVVAEIINDIQSSLRAAPKETSIPDIPPLESSDDSPQQTSTGSVGFTGDDSVEQRMLLMTLGPIGAFAFVLIVIFATWQRRRRHTARKHIYEHGNGESDLSSPPPLTSIQEYVQNFSNSVPVTPPNTSNLNSPVENIALRNLKSPHTYLTTPTHSPKYTATPPNTPYSFSNTITKKKSTFTSSNSFPFPGTPAPTPASQVDSLFNSVSDGFSYQIVQQNGYPEFFDTEKISSLPAAPPSSPQLLPEYSTINKMEYILDAYVFNLDSELLYKKLEVISQEEETKIEDSMDIENSKSLDTNLLSKKLYDLVNTNPLEASDLVAALKPLETKQKRQVDPDDLALRLAALSDLQQESDDDDKSVLSLANSDFQYQYSMKSEHTLYLQGNKDLNPAINRVLRLADEAVLDNTVYSVTKKPSDLLPPSADLHDYFSLARYYWPNKNSSNELPYYRVDGYTNPDIFDLPDSTWLQVVFNDVLNLGLAYFFTNNEIYAQKATVRLREWFINNSTKMNANLNFANWINGTAIGVVTGSIPMTKSGGLLDFSKLHYIIDGIGLIRNSESFTEEDYNSMVDWLTKYLHWLQTSPRGAFESSAQNNQGTWYDVQVVSILLFLGNIETAKKVQSTVTVGRISSQILSDGSEPLEQERANIYNYKTPQNVTILSALNYLLKHGMENGTNWPVKNLGAFDTKILTQISKDAYIQYFDVAYLNFANKMVKNNSYNWNPNRFY